MPRKTFYYKMDTPMPPPLKGETHIVQEIGPRLAVRVDRADYGYRLALQNITEDDDYIHTYRELIAWPMTDEANFKLATMHFLKDSLPKRVHEALAPIVDLIWDLRCQIAQPIYLDPCPCADHQILTGELPKVVDDR